MDILKSFGLKRYVSTILTTVIGVLSATPETAFLVPFVVKFAAFFGITGLVHAGKKGVLDLKGLSLVSLFSLLVFAAQSIPKLNQYESLLRLLAGILGITVLSYSEIPKRKLSAVEAKARAQVLRVAEQKATITKAADKKKK